MLEQQKGKLLVIIGPTAVGKTKLSIEMANGLTEKLLVVTPCKYIKEWILARQK